jgi:hypothetical protein
MTHYNFSTISHYVATQDYYAGLEAKSLQEKDGLMPKHKLKAELTSGPLGLFFKIYIKRRGYKDGFRGVIFALLSAWRRFLIYAKYWEMNKDHYDEG